MVLASIVDERRRGFALGAVDYMLKPIDRERLVQVLRGLCTHEGRRVLVVDDDDALRATVARALSNDGWSVVEAGGGREALDALPDAQPDVILLDLMMPGMNGFEFLEELRGLPEWSGTRVVVITAKDLTEEDRRSLDGGVAYVLQKSATTPSELLAELRRTLAECVGRQRRPVEAGDEAA